MTSLAEQQALTERFTRIQKKVFTLQPEAKILAVSKNQPAWKVSHLYQHLHHRFFGENHLTELKEKVAALPTEILWTYLGRLQSHHWKVLKKKPFRLATIDRTDPITWAEKHPPTKPLPCLIQIALEPQPHRLGVDENELPVLAQALSSCPHFQWEGLLFMPLEERSEKERSEQFLIVSKLFHSLKKNYRNLHQLNTLSMGMSDDFECALRAGATEVRIGTAIFGERDS